MRLRYMVSRNGSVYMRCLCCKEQTCSTFALDFQCQINTDLLQHSRPFLFFVCKLLPIYFADERCGPAHC